MPKEYGTLKHKVPLEGDEPPKLEKAFTEFSDSLAKPPTGATGQIAIVQSTGSLAYKAMKGDATLAEDGTLTIVPSAVGESEISDGAVTSRKAKLTAGLVTAKESLSLSTSFENLPGTELKITPAIPSLLKVTAIFMRVPMSGKSFNAVLGRVVLDGLTNGVAEARIPMLTVAEESERDAATASQIYLLSLTAAAHTLVMQAKRPDSSLPASANGQFIYELLAA